jgi:acyl-coenzyme A thioesterase PaaI-like protein
MSVLHLPFTRDCFVCGAHNPHGLRLRFRLEHGEVRAEFCPQAHHAGFRGIVHGGIIATALDEAMFWAAACARKRFCLAAELKVRFVNKVAAGQPLLIVARFVADRGRVWESAAELRDASGAACARAVCKQVPMREAEMRHAAADFLPEPGTAAPGELFPGVEW